MKKIKTELPMQDLEDILAMREFGEVSLRQTAPEYSQIAYQYMLNREE